MLATKAGSDAMVSALMGDGVTVGSVGKGTTTGSRGGAEEGVELTSPSSVKGPEQPTSNSAIDAA